MSEPNREHGIASESDEITHYCVNCGAPQVHGGSVIPPEEERDIIASDEMAVRIAVLQDYAYRLDEVVEHGTLGENEKSAVESVRDGLQAKVDRHREKKLGDTP